MHQTNQLVKNAIRVFSTTNKLLTKLPLHHFFSTDNKKTYLNSEIEKFDAINDWWSKDGSMAGLHGYNKLRISFIKKNLSNANLLSPKFKFLSGLQILDAGCGAGILSETMARFGGNITAVDMSEETIKVANLHKQMDYTLENNLNYINTSIEQLVESKKETIDMITSMEVIEHIENKKEFLTSIHS